MPNPRSRLSPAWLAVTLAVVVGCGPAATPTSPPSPSPSPLATGSPAVEPWSAAASGDPLAVYAAIAGQVEQIRGLQPKASITPVLIDEATLRANLTADFDHDNPPTAVHASQAILTLLGLLAPGTSLRAAYLDLESGQVIGYYSPDHDQLFLVSRSGGVGPTQKVTYAHEFTHQLQDQNFDLSKLGLDVPDQGDRGLARLALVEGDAVTTQTTWMTKQLTAPELAQVIADASDPAAAAALARAPEVLRTTSLFPYTQGFAFVGQLMIRDATRAVDAAFANPPASTEQVLHPEKYFAREAPFVVTLRPDIASAVGSGWTATAQDTLGELLLKTWLTIRGVPEEDATTAAAGWGGDRIQLLTGPHGDVALAIVTRWDTATDASEFAASARTAVSSVTGVARLVAAAGSRQVTISIAPTASEADAISKAIAR